MIVFSPSAPQSGTWFVLRFFEKLGCRREHVGEIINREVNQAVDISSNVILHTHIFPFYYQPDLYKESWPSFGGDPIKEYVVRKNNMSMTGIKLLCSLYKTVIPIRDPLASLLTREVRAPNLRHFYIVDAYVEISKLVGHPNVKFLPVDLDYTPDEKIELLSGIVRHCGLGVKLNKNIIEKVATKWERENVTPGNRFHAPYGKKDIDTIREWLGPKWAEVVHLKNMGGMLVPFLTGLGYNRKRTLIW